MSVIKVKFDQEKHAPTRNREYVYLCEYTVEVGDRVIVDSPYNGLVAVTVTDTSAGLAAINATKEVVCLIDATRYETRKLAKARLVEIGVELQHRETNIVQTKRFKKLFKNDKAARKLLKEADTLGLVLKGDLPGFLTATGVVAIVELDSE